MARDRTRRTKRRGKVFRAFERAVLGFGMSVMVFVAERLLKRAIAKGRGGEIKAPRTAAQPGEEQGGLAATPQQVEQ
jgi:hypothetical protein